MKIFLISTLISLNIYSQSFRIDTQKIFEDERIANKSNEDCAIRVLAISFKIDYRDALKTLLNNGAYIKNKGTKRKEFIEYLGRTGKASEIIPVENKTANEIKLKFQDGNYIVFSDKHVFYINIKGSRVNVFGNSDDYDKKINLAIKLI